MLQKLLLSALLFAALPNYSQDVYQVHIGTYASGDTIPDDAVKDLQLFYYCKNGIPQGGDGLQAWELLVFNNDKTTTSFPGDSWPYTIADSERDAILGTGGYPRKIVIQGIKISVENESGFITIKPPPETFYRAKTAWKKSAVAMKTVILEGKILTGAKNKVPVANQKVVLKDEKNVEIKSAVTDKYGDFTFPELANTSKYWIEVPISDKIKDGVVYLAKQNGEIVESFAKSEDKFTYELIPPEWSTLIQEKEEDPGLAIKKLTGSSASRLTVVENIYFAENSAEVKSESLPKLDQIVSSLTTNKNLKLLITGYTDSKGDDGTNLILSSKRAQKVMDYLVSKGISKERIKAEGKGETKILNRCVNGVDCSDKEHQYNRRTEFTFLK
jgi:outer membrane protein OmpA-like peptidoglycan-associated protein